MSPRGPFEARAALLMRDAPDCNAATHRAVIELGRALDAQAALIARLEDRLDHQPSPPVAREQMRMVSA